MTEAPREPDERDLADHDPEEVLRRMLAISPETRRRPARTRLKRAKPDTDRRSEEAVAAAKPEADRRSKLSPSEAAPRYDIP